MSTLGFGIVGTGLIANVTADAITQSKKAKLVAVSSRKLATAKTFVENRSGVTAVEGFENLLKQPDVDAIYIATPTSAKEEIALAAIKEGMHILIDKPFTDHASIKRMASAAREANVALMDATHFVHHPRTAKVQSDTTKKIGTPKSLHTSFFFPLDDSTNIRFDRKQEPMGAIGDMAWYSMRAVVEYLRPEGGIKKVVAIPEYHQETKAIQRVSGLISFADGKSSTFDAGYTAGVLLMDVQILGTSGVISMDDFVLDWTNSWANKNAQIKTGYSYKTGMATRSDATFEFAPSDTPAEVLMIEDFVDLVNSDNGYKRTEYANASLKTQEYVDAIWAAAQ